MFFPHGFRSKTNVCESTPWLSETAVSGVLDLRGTGHQHRTLLWASAGSPDDVLQMEVLQVLTCGGGATRQDVSTALFANDFFLIYFVPLRLHLEVALG